MNTFLVSHNTRNLRKDVLSWTKAYIRGTLLGFCQYILSPIQCENINFWNFIVDIVYV